MKFRLFGRKKGGEKEEVEKEQPPPSPPAGGEEIAIGVVSGKGGCGKSTITANMVVLLAALYGKQHGVLAIDMDITNATLTSLLLSITPDVLREDDGISTIDYMVEEPAEFKTYRLEFPPRRAFNIQVSKQKELGVLARNIYVLPAKKATLSYDMKLKQLRHITNEDVRSSLQSLYHNAIAFAKRNRIKYIFFDFPPMRADAKKLVYEGVLFLLELVPKCILVSSFDYSALHGLISLVSERYAFLKTRTLSVMINMSRLDDADVVERMRSYVRNSFGWDATIFIRDDPRWRVNILPPIVLGDPGEGAHYDLIRACTKIGVADPATVKEKLNVEVR